MKRSPLMVNHTISHWWYHAVKDSLDNLRSPGHHLFIPGWVSDSIFHCFRSGNMLKVRICKRMKILYRTCQFYGGWAEETREKGCGLLRALCYQTESRFTWSKLQIYAAWPPQQSMIETKHLNNTWIQMFMLKYHTYEGILPCSNRLQLLLEQLSFLTQSPVLCCPSYA